MRAPISLPLPPARNRGPSIAFVLYIHSIKKLFQESFRLVIIYFQCYYFIFHRVSYFTLNFEEIRFRVPDGKPNCKRFIRDRVKGENNNFHANFLVFLQPKSKTVAGAARRNDRNFCELMTHEACSETCSATLYV